MTIQILNKIRSLSCLITASAIISMSVSSASMAKDYMVEVVVFENNAPSAATESLNYKAPRPSKSNSKTWLIEPSMLIDEAARIERSPNYTLVHHFSWGQKALPFEKSANYSILEQELNGWVKIYAEQLLFANIDLDYSGYRMNEKRRLKLNEKHFFDHPKFGVLLQVSRLKAPVEKTDQTVN